MSSDVKDPCFFYKPKVHDALSLFLLVSDADDVSLSSSGYTEVLST